MRESHAGLPAIHSAGMHCRASEDAIRRPTTAEWIGRKYVPPKEPRRSTSSGERFGRNSG
eukprot:scaffold442_cov268-Pinguiococcus_pyrenoidosus.AAC.8